jgi:hypothetical protein
VQAVERYTTIAEQFVRSKRIINYAETSAVPARIISLSVDYGEFNLRELFFPRGEQRPARD